MRQLWIDDRYRGRHGIARYASEVVPRLDLAWRELPVGGKPAHLHDVVAKLPGVHREDVIYSPGYAAFPRAMTQILTVHDLIHLQTPWRQRSKYLAYYNAILRPAIKRAGVVLTVSETSAEAIRSWVGDDDFRIVNTGNACSEAFRSSGPSRQTEAPYLLFVGNMRSHKNAHVALSVLKRLRDLDLRMLVPEREVDEAKARAESLGVARRVTVLSGLSDQTLAEEYRGAVATVLPSSLEGFGLPAIESISCGTPVVYWRGCNALAEASLGTGYAVDDLHDQQAWVEAIERAAAARVSLTHGVPTWDSVAKIVRGEIENLVRE